MYAVCQFTSLAVSEYAADLGGSEILCYSSTMKLMFLNVWGKEMQDSLAPYIEQEAKTTDIFCFQEAYDNVQQLCERILPDFRCFSDYKFVTESDDFPQAIYVKNGIKIVSSDVLLKNLEQCGLGLYIEIETKSGRMHICNFHGISQPGHKLDDPARLRQSQELLHFFADKDGAKIIGGDFNLFPQTKSIKMFAKHGYRDLIQEFNIKTTRNRLSWELWPTPQFFSDYVFISPDVKLNKFEVPNNEVSDHLPLILEIDA